MKSGSHRIENDNFKYFSLFSFEDTVITLNHCLYPLDNYILKDNDPLCCSNQMIDDYVNIECNRDILLIQSK